MNKPLVRIKNFSFSHDLSSCAWTEPTYFNWIRDQSPADEYTFVTDEYLKDYADSNSIAFLVEPPSVNGPAYQFAYENQHKFKYILTFCEDLIKVCKNGLFYPYGATRLNKNQRKIFSKQKNISLILSNKIFTDGHRFRHACKNFVLNKNVDIFQAKGEEYVDKFDTCQLYRYSIVVENGKYESYFSEKIIDCLVTGVIPIYHGCPSIDKFFNPDGIIKFNSLEELDVILKYADNKLYELKMDAIKENFELAKKYLIAEDWIYKEYPFLFNI